MESITYRNTELLVKTIPKGTLMFRISKDHERSLRGRLIDDNKRCINPSFNVYFHPTPFTPYHMYKDDYKDMIGNKVGIYILEKDVKVILLINPAKQTRVDGLKKKTFIRPCSTVKKMCKGQVGRTYDACLSDTIIKKYPSIVGMLGISAGDNALYRKALKRGIKKRTLRKITKVSDNSTVGAGIPELALYPLTKRSTENVISDETTKLDTNYSIMEELEYDEAKLNTFLENHGVLDEETGYYIYKE